ncbi:MAG: transposase, partial [Leptolyngbya sp. SIO3F4]|nr:transposase [Leptolyngbya sp. SIO3F4]
LKLVGTYDLEYYPVELIKRVRLVRRADGYYCQFCIKVDRSEPLEPKGNTIGLDVGLESFYTDSNGYKEENPRFYRKAKKKRKRLNRRLSKKVKGSRNRAKARNKLARLDLKISRQRKESAKRMALCVIKSNDLVAYEDLKIRHMVKNHCLAKSITDAGWYQFRVWLEHFGRVHDRITVAVEPAYTSQQCSNCGAIVKKSLSTRTHVCECGHRLDRDHNAAINILSKALSTVGHTGTSLLDRVNASEDSTSFVSGVTQAQKVKS